MQSYYQKLVLWFAGMALLAPLLVSPFTIFPYTIGKVVWFQLGVLGLLVVWLYWTVRQGKILLPKASLVLWAVLLWLASGLLSVLFSLDVSASFWGDAERMDGAVNLVYYSSFFFLLVVLMERATWEKLITVFISVGTITALSAWAQMAGLFPFPASSFGGRISGLLGNPGFLAGFLILPSGIALLRAVLAKSLAQKKRNLAAALLMMITIIATATRGAMIGVLAGAVVVLVWLVFKRGVIDDRFRKIGCWTLAGAGLLFGGLIIMSVTGTNLGFKPIDRLASISLKDDTTQTRIASLRFSLEAFQKKPLIGWGWNQYSVAYNKYFDPAQMPGSPAGIWFDKAHNELAEYAVETGLLGLASYLFLFGAAFIVLLKIYRQQKKLPALIIGGALMAYFIHNLFLFDTPASYIALFFVLAYLHSQFVIDRRVLAVPAQIRSTLVVLGVVSIVSAFWWVSVLTIWAATKAERAEALVGSDPARAISLFVRAAQIHPTVAPNAILKTAESVISTHTFPNAQSQPYQEALSGAAEQALLYAKAHSFSVKHLMAAGRLLTIQGAYQPKALDLAEPILNKALELAPKRANVYYELGILRMQQGDSKAALAVFEEALAIDSKEKRSLWALGITKILLGEVEQGLKRLEEAIARGYQLTAMDAANLGRTYLKVERYDKAAEAYQKAVELEPKEAQWYAALAVSQSLNGQQEQANISAQRAFELDPTGFGSEKQVFLELLKTNPKLLRGLIIKQN